jgi:hypothetical protein
MDRRKAEFSQDDIPKIYWVDGKSGFQSRYSHYRRQKVQEYANFVQERYRSKLGAYNYDLDPSYMVYDPSQTDNLVDFENMEGDPAKDINFKMVHSVARSLARTTVYIRELRERLKLQARKCYMKGTNNLILYLVNEYLIDYSRNAIATDENISSNQYLLSSF